MRRRTVRFGKRPPPAASAKRLSATSPKQSLGEVTKALREVRSMIVEASVLEDAGTADMFTEISRSIDKMLWFVEAHSQAKS